MAWKPSHVALLIVTLGTIFIIISNTNNAETTPELPEPLPPKKPTSPPPLFHERPNPSGSSNNGRSKSPLITEYDSIDNVELVNNYFTQQEIDDALKEIGKVLTRHLTSKEPVPKTCTIVQYGSNNGKHALCEINHNHCRFLSFGINRDYSFDKQLVDEGCIGAGFDPSNLASGYQAKLQNNLYFLAVGANSLDYISSEWVMSSVPKLASLFGMHKLAVLKMDCEGCEYALARDIIIEDPNFFNRVEQFAVEIHVGKFLMKTKEHLQNFGRLVRLLSDAGLELQDASLAPCSEGDEALGCYPGLTDLGYPCAKGIMCQNLLFARKV